VPVASRRRFPARRPTPLALLLSLLASCGGDTGPSADDVTSLAIVSGPAAAVSGLLLPDSIIVELRSAGLGAVPLAGVVITASVSSGSLRGTTAVATNAAGRAIFTALLIDGNDTETEIQFTCCDLEPALHRLSLERSAVVLTRASDRLITARAGSVVSPGPRVQILDLKQNPVAGTEVTFTMARGGTIPVTTVLTDAGGVAELPSFVMYDLPGSGRITASAEGTGQAVTFDLVPTVSATGAVELVNAQPLSAAATGATFTLPVVRVTDGGPVPNTQVRYRVINGDGVVSSETVLTDANGESAPATLTAGRGPNTVEIVAPGYSTSARYISVVGATGPVTLIGGLYDYYGYFGYGPAPEFDWAGSAQAYLWTEASDALGPLPPFPVTVSKVGAAGEVYLEQTVLTPEAIFPTESVISWQIPDALGMYEIHVSGLLVGAPLVFRATRVGG
jgi:hypothetical protein